MEEIEVQTEQAKNESLAASAMVAELRSEMRGNYTKEVMKLLKEAEEQRRAKKRKPLFRRGKKSFYENAIDEEDSPASEKSDKAAQNAV